MSDSVSRGPCVGKLGPEEAIYHTRTRPPKKREMDGRERAKETNTWKLSYTRSTTLDAKFFFNGRAMSAASCRAVSYTRTSA